MFKTTQREIRRYISTGVAIDVTTAQELPKCYDKVAYSSGVYGINGGLYKDGSGNLYAITARSTNLFRIF